MKALIKDNLVVDVCETEFEVHPSLVWVDAVNDCVVGWTYENGQFTAPIQPQLTYSDYRKREYPTIGDQLDALFRAGVFPAEMAALIQAVKDKYPKEQS
jgi:hypothetical protein